MKKLILPAALAFGLLTLGQPVAKGLDEITSFFPVSEAYAKTKHRKMKRQRYASAHGLVVASARRYGVPVNFALRVARQESGVQCGRWGDRGKSGGALQIYWPTARSMFGVRSFQRFRSLSCATLTDMGMKHLALAYRSARGNLCLASQRHNAGLGASSRQNAGRGYANAVVGGCFKKGTKHAVRRKHK